MSDGFTAERRGWVERVLGIRLPETASQARAGEAASVAAGAVNYAKLQLRWREAQTRAQASMVALAQQFLAVPEVKADPRLGQVQAAMATLPGLVPRFGDTLADQLDALTNGGPGAEDMKRDALATLVGYRAALAAVPVLTRLEVFAKQRLSADLPSASALSAVLAELETALSARP